VKLFHYVNAFWYTRGCRPSAAPQPSPGSTGVAPSW